MTPFVGLWVLVNRTMTGSTKAFGEGSEAFLDVFLVKAQAECKQRDQQIRFDAMFHKIIPAVTQLKDVPDMPAIFEDRFESIIDFLTKPASKSSRELTAAVKEINDKRDQVLYRCLVTHFSFHQLANSACKKGNEKRTSAEDDNAIYDLVRDYCNKIVNVNYDIANGEDHDDIA